MFDVRVCPSCLTKRHDGLSRVSPAMWQATLEYVAEHQLASCETVDGITQCRDQCGQLLLSDADGPYVQDTLLADVIRAGFRSQRARF